MSTKTPLDTNLTVELAKDKEMVNALSKLPKLAELIAKNKKIAHLLLKKDKRLLPIIIADPEYFDWLFSKVDLTKNIDALHACILSDELAHKVASNNNIIKTIHGDTLVDLAELMIGNSDMAKFLNQIDNTIIFTEVARLVMTDREISSFLQDNPVGQDLIKLSLAKDNENIIARAIAVKPDYFDGKHTILNIPKEDVYNRLLSKNVRAFPHIADKIEKSSSQSDSNVPETEEEIKQEDKNSNVNKKTKNIIKLFNVLLKNLNNSNRSKFLSDYKILSFNDISAKKRQSGKDVPSVFKLAKSGKELKSMFYAYRLKKHKYAVMPNLPRYNSYAHNAVGLKDIYDTNFSDSDTKEYKMKIDKPAIFEFRSGKWKLIDKGSLSLN